MKKRYFWGVQDSRELDGKLRIARFRSEAERGAWIQNGESWPGFGLPKIDRFGIDSTHILWSEVRRINRQLAVGLPVEFPVVVEAVTLQLKKIQSDKLLQKIKPDTSLKKVQPHKGPAERIRPKH